MTTEAARRVAARFQAQRMASRVAYRIENPETTSYNALVDSLDLNINEAMGGLAGLTHTFRLWDRAYMQEDAPTRELQRAGHALDGAHTICAKFHKVFTKWQRAME